LKKFLLATAGLLAIGVAAPVAADDLGRPYTPSPAMPIVYDWSGLYVGGNAGWGQNHSCWNFVPIAGAIIPDGCRDQSSGVIGGQFGYRWQASQFVFGLEGQVDWADISSSHISVIHPAFTTRSQLPGIGLVTGQVGLAWNAALLYVKGGAAVTGNTYEILTTVGGDVVATAVTSRWGGTVGVGIEYGFGPNWSAGIEYNHLFMGSSNSSVSATVVNPIVPGALNRISQDLDIVTIRANYRFGGSVVAGY